MSAAAIVMMVVTILLVWGGLVASIVALRGGNSAQDEAERADTLPSAAEGEGLSPSAS